MYDALTRINKPVWYLKYDVIIIRHVTLANYCTLTAVSNHARWTPNSMKH